MIHLSTFETAGGAQSKFQLGQVVARDDRDADRYLVRHLQTGGTMGRSRAAVG